MLGEKKLVKKILQLVVDQLMSQINPTLINNKIRKLEEEVKELKENQKMKICKCKEVNNG